MTLKTFPVGGEQKTFQTWREARQFFSDLNPRPEPDPDTDAAISFAAAELSPGHLAGTQLASWLEGFTDRITGYDNSKRLARNIHYKEGWNVAENAA